MSDNFLKIDRGINLPPQGTDPTNPTEGDIFYASSSHGTKSEGTYEYNNSAWVSISGGGGSGGGLDKWLTATVYNEDDVVWYDGDDKIYVCTAAGDGHTSGTFATDKASNYWDELSAESYTDLMTTRGDTLYRNSSNVTNRLPVGNAGQFIGTDGTDTSWTDLPLEKGGPLNFYPEGIAERAIVGDFATGNNTTFDNGGTLQGIFSISTTAADLIRELKSFKLVLHATPGTSDDDWVASETIDIAQGYRGRVLAVQLQYKYDGADDDIKWVVKDQTNTVLLTFGAELFKQFIGSDNISSTFSLTFFCPSDCEQIKIGPQVLTHATGSEELIWDDVVVTPDPFVDKELMKIQTLVVRQPQNVMTNLTTVRFNLGTATINDDGDSLMRAEDDTYTHFIANQDCHLTINSNGLMNATGKRMEVQHNVKGLLNRGSYSTASQTYSLSETKVFMKAGEYIFFNANSLDNHANTFQVELEAKALTDNIVTPLKTAKEYSEANGDFTVTSSVGGWSTTTSTIVPYRTQNGDWRAKINIDGQVNSTTFHQLTISGLTYRNDAAVATIPNSADWGSGFTQGAASHMGLRTGTSATGWRVFVDAALAGKPTWAQDVDAQYLAAAPKPLTCYLKDVKSTGTNGGGSTGGVDHTRTLNTLSGDTGFISISANQITLGSGSYNIEASAPAYRAGKQRVFWRNITDSTNDILGQSVEAQTIETISMHATLEGSITITSTKVFELRHYIETTIGGSGLGRPVSDGRDEVYAQVKIIKVN